MPRPTLETFLDWLEGRGVQVICCGDQGQPPPIAGEMPHDWFRGHAAYYEEVEVDHRAKDPLLKALKKRIRLQPDRGQCREVRKALPGCLGWERIVGAWKPCDLILTSRQKVRDRAQRLLFERHEKCFPDAPVPLLYRPKDIRRQNIMVTTPGPLLDGRPDQQELVLNDVVRCLEICPRGPRRQVGPGLGSWLRPHRSLEPGSHSCRPLESLDHRRLSPVVQPGLSCSLTGGVSQPARAGSMPPQRRALRAHAHSQSSSSARPS